MNSPTVKIKLILLPAWLPDLRQKKRWLKHLELDLAKSLGGLILKLSMGMRVSLFFHLTPGQLNC